MKILKLVFYVPESHLEKVKNAIFAAGAGKIGQYENCAWQTLGVGQFKPLTTSNPYIGNKQQITCVSEYKVEMICSEEIIEKVIIALKQAHPYESPAYEAWPIIYYS